MSYRDYMVNISYRDYMVNKVMGWNVKQLVKLFFVFFK